MMLNDRSENLIFFPATLARRGAWFYLHLTLPPAIRNALARKQIKIALRTKHLLTAQRLFPIIENVIREYLQSVYETAGQDRIWFFSWRNPQLYEIGRDLHWLRQERNETTGQGRISARKM